MSKKIEVKKGDRYGRLTIVKEIKKIHHRRFLCKCDCGNYLKVELDSMRRKKTISCGCYNKEQSSKAHKKHGLSNHKIYSIWRGMLDRCFRKDANGYENYGGRGITVCDEWRNDFMSFYNWAIDSGWKGNLQIDRIDNDGNYEPSNCRFVTLMVNNRKKRKEKNTTSKYIGVIYHKRAHKYMAYIMVNHKNHHLGYHDTEELAVTARNDFIINNNLKKDYGTQDIT